MSSQVHISPQLTRALLILLVACLFTASASAIGIVVPREPDLAAPQLQSVDVSAQVKDHIARTRITQVYSNPNSKPIEADFFFPVPQGADITDFVLYMNGKPVKGEVLDKEKAHDIYREIVRKMRDPGLVEWADKNLFRVRIFPIPANGEQKLEIEISQPLTADQGYFRYFLPVEWNQHPKSSASPQITFRVSLNANSPVRNVYSPTHKIDTDTSNSKSVVVTAEAPLSDTKDFLLYYEPSEENIAASLLTHSTPGADGYFSLRISPPWDETTTAPDRQGGNYVFVIDTSGSMAEGDKIEQARKALNYCVSLLDEKDNFNLIRFSTTVDPYQSEMVQATKSNRDSAAAWIAALDARGGTNISEALKRALNQRDSKETTQSAERMFTVVFLTDGLPTVGQTSTDAIIESVEKESGGNVRVFTFGVGHDVNTRLLDSIAEETRAASDYVAPDADLEVPVSRFFDKVNRPALFNVELKIPDAGVMEIYPPRLPDLFYGTELAVYGKYTGTTTSPIILTGTIGGSKQEYRFEKNFPAEEKENPFIEKLWATRKVAWLLDQVRKAGESDELRSEIEELAHKYSIVTPYTSYLAMEDKKENQPNRSVSATPTGGSNIWSFGETQTSSRTSADKSQRAPASARAALQKESGAAAVHTARQLGRMKTADAVQTYTQQDDESRKTVDGKTFILENGQWKDTSITGKEDSIIKIRYMSEAWFQISEEFPEIRNYLSLGEQVALQIDASMVLQIGAEGIESIDVATRQKLSKTLGDNN